jgi:toxin ParE1/3/4
VKRRVLVREAARDDLEEQAEFLARTSPGSALRFLDAAEAAFRRLARSPGLRRRLSLSSPFLRGIRSRPVPGFDAVLLFYRPVRDGIEVVRVLHGARDLPGLLDEGR